MSDTTRKQYDENFKRHIVELYDAGQTRAELAKAYNLHPTSVSNWIRFYKNSGSFKAKDNLTDEQKRIRELEKQLKDKQMEIDILKKAMVVMLKT
ncbi:transposase [Acetivibrio straminisolvens]|jgi:transposase|uniref:transposase n=1 Tax=Acetivibrio straminisolvens TaxID=253314 RepID=UPI00223F63CB|nr:transposase [Acetivibrio straminisolvens]